MTTTDNKALAERLSQAVSAMTLAAHVLDEAHPAHKSPAAQALDSARVAVEEAASALTREPSTPSAHDYVPGELDRTAPARIWLQIDTSGDNAERDEPWPGADHVTWQDESIGGLEIQYVRADLATPSAQADKARGEVVALELRRLRYQADQLDGYGMRGAAENIREAADKIEAFVTPQPQGDASGQLGDFQDKAMAWDAVFAALTSVAPGWTDNGRTGVEAAVTTIRKLATPQVPGGGEGIHPDFARLNTIDELADAIVKNTTSDKDDPVLLSDVRDCLIRAQQLAALYTTPQPQGDASGQVSGGGEVADGFALVDRSVIPTPAVEMGKRMLALARQMGWNDEATAMLVFTEMVPLAALHAPQARPDGGEAGFDAAWGSAPESKRAMKGVCRYWFDAGRNPAPAPDVDYVDIANRTQEITGKGMNPSTVKAVLEAFTAAQQEGQP